MDHCLFEGAHDELRDDDAFYNLFQSIILAGTKKDRESYWETADGKRLKVKDMDNQHIRNSLSKCKRDNWRLEFVPAFDGEIKRRRVNRG